MDYTDYLASRGYKRITVERTSKAPGDVVIHSSHVERIPDAPRKVVQMRRAK